MNQAKSQNDLKNVINGMTSAAKAPDMQGAMGQFSTAAADLSGNGQVDRFSNVLNTAASGNIQ